MSQEKQTFIVGGGSVGLSVTGKFICVGLSVTEALSERGIKIIDSSNIKEVSERENPFAPEPIAFTNPYEGLPEWKYTPTFNSGKSRKCSNKKYVKRKKARNGR